MRRLGHGHSARLIWPLIVLLAAGCGGSGSGEGAGGGVIIDPQDPVVPPPGSVTPQRVFPLLSFIDPVLLLQAPGNDELWFVVEQRGIVRVFGDNGNAGTSTVFLNIEARVNSAASEAGLLGMAFHPDFETNGYFYLSYTVGAPFRNRISRFSVSAATGRGDASSEQVLLEIAQPASNHNGGHIAFDYDNSNMETNLYIGIGDGGGAGDPFENGQDTTTLLGAILRIPTRSAAEQSAPAAVA